jgi:hypothetical protein
MHTLSAICEFEHDAAKGRFETNRDCSFERPLQRRRLHRSIKIAATADKCCVSNSRTCIRPLSPQSVSSPLADFAVAANGRSDGPHRSILRW